MREREDALHPRGCCEAEELETAPSEPEVQRSQEGSLVRQISSSCGDDLPPEPSSSSSSLEEAELSRRIRRLNSHVEKGRFAKGIVIRSKYRKLLRCSRLRRGPSVDSVDTSYDGSVSPAVLGDTQPLADLLGSLELDRQNHRLEAQIIIMQKKEIRSCRHEAELSALRQAATEEVAAMAKKLRNAETALSEVGVLGQCEKELFQNLELSDGRYAELRQLPSASLSLKDFVVMRVYEMILPYRTKQAALQSEIESLRVALKQNACASCESSAIEIRLLQVRPIFSPCTNRQHYQEAKAKVEKAEHLLTAVERLKRESRTSPRLENEKELQHSHKQLEQELQTEKQKAEELQRDLLAAREEAKALESQLRESQLVAKAAVYKQVADQQEALLSIHSMHEEERKELFLEFERRVAEKECEIRERAEQAMLQHKLQLEASEVKASTLEVKYKQAESRYEEVAAALCKTHAAHQESLAQLSSQLHMNAAELHKMRCALEVATEVRDRSAEAAEDLQKRLQLADEEMANLRDSERKLKLQCETLRVDLASFEHLDARVSDCLQLIVSSGSCPSADLLLPLAEAKLPGYKHLEKTVALALKLGEVSKQLEETKEKLQLSTSRAQKLTILLQAEKSCRGLNMGPFSAVRNRVIQAEALRLQTVEALQREKEKTDFLRKQNQRLAEDLRNCLEARKAIEDCIKKAVAVNLPCLPPHEQQQQQPQQHPQQHTQQQPQQQLQQHTQQDQHRGKPEGPDRRGLSLPHTLATPLPSHLSQQQQRQFLSQNHQLHTQQEQQQVVQQQHEATMMRCLTEPAAQRAKEISTTRSSELQHGISVCPGACSATAAPACCSGHCTISTAASNGLAVAQPPQLQCKSCCCGAKRTHREDGKWAPSQQHRHAHSCRDHSKADSPQRRCKVSAAEAQHSCCCSAAAGPYAFTLKNIA
ncbi:hypothetical protein Esti_005654 [Eimeria stiedai]